MELELALYDNESLKSKRSVVKRVIHRCRNKFNVAAAEVADHDLTDRAIIGVVTVGNDGRVLRSKLDKLESFVEGLALADVIRARCGVLESMRPAEFQERVKVSNGLEKSRLANAHDQID